MHCTSINQSLFIDALHCRNQHHRPPVWIMRQAGRYMPSYQNLKKKYSLDDLFRIKDLITEVSLLPIHELDVDAAIIFSDILLILECLGFKVSYPLGQGPLVSPKIHNAIEVGQFKFTGITPSLAVVMHAIKELKQTLKVPLIGFCGGPFSLLSYVLEEEHRSELKKTKEWLYTHPKSIHELLERITSATIIYLQSQIDAGVDVIQIFDSWAGVLSHAEFKEFSFRYLKKIMDAFRNTTVPIILFARGTSYYLEDFLDLKPTAISLDWLMPLDRIKKLVPDNIAIQGNLDPHLLLGSQAIIKTKTLELLELMKDHPGFILNLGHGVLPHTPYENVKCLVDTVKTFGI